MAIRYAVANGNWSNTATWDGGTLPGSTDDVYSNNRTVTIDQDITVNSLKKISNVSPAITAGGLFTVNGSYTVTITAGIQAADNSTNGTGVLTVNAPGSTVTISAPGGITPRSGSNSYGVILTAGDIDVTADLTGGGAAGANAIVVNGASSAVTLTGNVQGGSAAAIVMNFSSTLTLTGDVTGGTSSLAVGAVGLEGSGSSATIVGDVVGGSGTTGIGVQVSGVSAVADITGAVTGGSGSSAFGVNCAGGSSTTTITGDVRGGSVTGAYGVSVSTAGAACTIRGSLRPGTSAAGTHATSATNGALLRFSGDVFSGGLVVSSGPIGFVPILGVWSVIDGEETSFHLFNDDNFPFGLDGTQTILQQYGTDNPVAADVRDGVTYGPSGTLAGTLAVPPAGSVSSGVPVDATVGTAVLSLSDLAAVTGAQIAAATTA